MANIKIAGDAVVIQSALKADDINLVKKYRPNELILKGGEDGKEPIFSIDVTTGKGGINEYGVSFSGVTRDEEKKACLTMLIPKDGSIANVEDWFVDTYGGAIINLNKLEERLPTVIGEIAAEKATVRENISVVQ